MSVPRPRGAASGWVQRLLAVGLGFALLAGLEVGLRLWPRLAPPPLIVDLAEVRGRVLRSTNALYSTRFFSSRYRGKLVASGRMAAAPFVEPASPQRYRVVFAGASTVQGYPHPRRLAAASFLEAMLQDAWPERQVQVLNLGITSIASYAVARVVEDAMALEPDLLVVYSGHNEFYGLYGSGGRYQTLRNRLRYGISGWRTPALLRLLLGAARGSQATSESLLRIMAERGVVPPRSPQRERAARQLRQSLRHMARTARGHDVRVVLCTLVANDAGFAPAASWAAGLGLGAEPEWQARVERAAAILTGQDITERTAAAALELLDGLPEGARLSAWPRFLEGVAYRHLDRGDEAGAAFREARDLDAMPWRAPSQHNAVIRQVADQPGVILADVESAFRRAAPPEGIGWQLMADHVHPTVTGQALLARAVVQSLADIGMLDSTAMTRASESASYSRRLGAFPVEEARALQAMSELLREPPMSSYNGHNGRMMAERAAAAWQGLSLPEQRGVLRWQRHREEVPLALDVAEELFAAGELAAAARHYAASRREAPWTPLGDLWATVQEAWCRRLMVAKGPGLSGETLRQALVRVEFLSQAPDMDPHFLDLVRGELHYFLGEDERAAHHLERAFDDAPTRRAFLYALFPALASALVNQGRTAEAREYAQLAQRESGGNPYFGNVVSTLAAGGAIGPPP